MITKALRRYGLVLARSEPKPSIAPREAVERVSMLVPLDSFTSLDVPHAFQIFATAIRLSELLHVPRLLRVRHQTRAIMRREYEQRLPFQRVSRRYHQLRNTNLQKSCAAASFDTSFFSLRNSHTHAKIHTTRTEENSHIIDTPDSLLLQYFTTAVRRNLISFLEKKYCTKVVVEYQKTMDLMWIHFKQRTYSFVFITV